MNECKKKMGNVVTQNVGGGVSSQLFSVKTTVDFATATQAFCESTQLHCPHLEGGGPDLWHRAALPPLAPAAWAGTHCRG